MADVTNKHTTDNPNSTSVADLNNAINDPILKSKTFYSSIENKDERMQRGDRLSWRHLLMSPCLMLHLYSYMFYGYVITQYIFQRIQSDKFPHLSSNHSTSHCDVMNESSVEKQQSIEVQQDISVWTLYNSLAASVPAIFFDIVIVSLSDRYGRKIPVIITLAGTFLKTLSATIGIYFDINIYIFITFSLVEGICGGWCCVLALGLAYAADLTKSGKNRTIGIVLQNLFVGLGLVLSGITSGYIIKGLGFFYAAMLLTVLNCFNLLMITFLLPETLSGEDTLTTYQSIKNAFRFYVTDSSTQKGRWIYIICISAFAIVTCVVVGSSSNDTVYELDRPFCWDSVKIGLYSSLSNLGRNVIGLGSIRLLQKFCQDLSIAIISIVSSLLSNCLQAFAFNDVSMFLVPVVGFLSSASDPIIRSTMSLMTPADRQGALFAGMAVVQTVFTVVGETLVKAIYTATLAYFRGLVYLVLAGMCSITFILIIILKHGLKTSKIQPIVND